MEGETDRAALAAKWLAALFWLTVPQGLSILLLPLRFGVSLPGLLGAALQLLCIGAAAWALWQLKPLDGRFGWAARWKLISLVPAVIGAVFGGALLRLGGTGLRGKPVLLVSLVLLLLIATAAAIGTRYLLCMGLAEVLAPAAAGLAKSWRGLWKGTLGLLVATVAALPLAALSLPLALMLDILILVGFIVLQITFLVRLYETVQAVRVFATEGFPPEEAETVEESGEKDSIIGEESRDIQTKIEESGRAILKSIRQKAAEVWGRGKK